MTFRNYPPDQPPQLALMNTCHQCGVQEMFYFRAGAVEHDVAFTLSVCKSCGSQIKIRVPDAAKKPAPEEKSQQEEYKNPYDNGQGYYEFLVDCQCGYRNYASLKLNSSYSSMCRVYCFECNRVHDIEVPPEVRKGYVPHNNPYELRVHHHNDKFGEHLRALAVCASFNIQHNDGFDRKYEAMERISLYGEWLITNYSSGTYYNVIGQTMYHSPGKVTLTVELSEAQARKPVYPYGDWTERYDFPEPDPSEDEPECWSHHMASMGKESKDLPKLETGAQYFSFQSSFMDKVNDKDFCGSVPPAHENARCSTLPQEEPKAEFKEGDVKNLDKVMAAMAQASGMSAEDFAEMLRKAASTTSNPR